MSEYCAPRGGNFKASRSTDPIRIWKQREELVPALPVIVSISPPRYPPAWERLRSSRFRQDHFSSTRSIRLNFRMIRDLAVSTPPISLAPALMANSLSRGQKRRTMRQK
jgi:hypothetical protein